MIVQEAADEDANIIFGAVIDPALKGKVKITVIATGFGAQASARPAATVSSTPVDMTQYADYARTRSEPVPVQAPAAMSMPLPAARMTIARRPLLDLPMAVSGGVPTPSSSSAGAASLPAVAPPAGGETRDADAMRAAAAADSPVILPDFDLGSTFDVPAFLRRQEG